MHKHAPKALPRTRALISVALCCMGPTYPAMMGHSLGAAMQPHLQKVRDSAMDLFGAGVMQPPPLVEAAEIPNHVLSARVVAQEDRLMASSRARGGM